MESNSMGSNYDDMHSDQLDNLSNLIINNGGSQGVSGGGGSGVLGAYGMGNNASPELGDTDNMLLEQYERDLDKGINDGHISERDQCYQRLFQSFQTSACTVAQMFKDKMTTPGSTSSLNASNQQQPQQPQLTSWQSFQSSAGAITLLYKDSLEACKSHYDIGVSVGQQRKLKELITWLKKKRRRTIRKDELIGFLIGKQQHSSLANGCSPASGSTSSAGTQASLASMFMMMNPSSNSTSATTNNSTPSQQNNNVFFNGLTKHQQSTLARAANPASGSNLLSANSATCPANLANIGQANDTSSDLATFREALIMHNRSRDGPLPHSQHLQNYVNHHHHHASSNHQAPCEDLDCFFCEQIATHAEPHKRSSSFMFNGNNCDNNMESSPTRKRSRFY